MRVASNGSFLSRDNMKLLWDIISNELSSTEGLGEKSEQLYFAFQTNARIFYDSHQGRDSQQTNGLLSLNKEFLSQMIQIIRPENANSIKTTNNRIKIHNEDVPIKAEDIQASRMSKFEAQYNQKKAEFENAVKRVVPETPIFADDFKEEKIEKMEDLIAQTVAQRNFDMEKLQESAMGSFQSDTTPHKISSSSKNRKKTISWQEDEKEMISNTHQSSSVASVFSRMKFLPDVEKPSSEIGIDSLILLFEKLEKRIETIEKSIQLIANSDSSSSSSSSLV